MLLVILTQLIALSDALTIVVATLFITIINHTIVLKRHRFRDL